MKSNKQIYLIAAIVVIVVLIIGYFGMKVHYQNKFVVKDQAVEEAWGNVENQYQRRLDLIPNLVSTVKGYAEHESGTLEAVTNARAGLQNAYNDAQGSLSKEAPNDLQKFQEAQSNLNRQLGIYINAVHEAYPDLKANENFRDLQTQLEGTENRIATERQRYNEVVKAYNEAILTFPGSMFRGDYEKREMFKAEQGAEHAPKVSF